MSDIQIFEPAMCCSTGLCGPSIDPELLRVSTIFDALQKEVAEKIAQRKIAVAVSGRYPTTEEFAAWSGIDTEKLPKAAAPAKESAPAKSPGSCCCGSSGCC